MPAGRRSALSLKPRQHAPGVTWWPFPPASTSQDCSGCGERVRKSLSVRTHICPSCGLVLDRDENAARNIQWAGQVRRGVAGMSAAVNREAPCL
ncbi:MAG TPA: zinc ribbon domain-containing protein [Ktedonobacterales bacterium]|nr:zinc ribbon domain-containing protein [Ktedonobacterales bacterium]